MTRTVPVLAPARSAALLALAALIASGCASAPGGSPAPLSAAAAPGSEYRIYDADGNRIGSASAMLRSLGGARVVFLGEQHGDPGGHRFQRDFLDAVAEASRPTLLALEMFERDVQTDLDAFLRGQLAEDAFLERSRPWGTYARDYRPLVERARAEGWPVVASNVPRPLAALVAREGLEAVERLEPTERAHVARELLCPRDEYFERFARVMQEHPAPHGDAAAFDALVWRMYEAQCVKDETMAEALAERMDGAALAVHVNGSFHSDHHLGIVPRLLRRAPDTRVAVVSSVPVGEEDDRTVLERNRGRADFLVLTGPY